MKSDIEHIKIFPLAQGKDLNGKDLKLKSKKTEESDFLELTGKEGVSSFWRKNISSREAIELANLLRALRKVAGYVGPNVGRIEWFGMSSRGEGVIALNPKLVLGKYPVPSEKVDYLVGLVIHEGLLRTEWSDLVWKNLEPVFRQMKMQEQIIFQKIIYTGESIYVDLIADESIMGLYTEKARRVGMEYIKSKLALRRITVDELIYLWWKSVWDDIDEYLIGEKKEAYQEPLNILNDITQKLREIVQSRKNRSITKLCQQRSDLYKEGWDRVKDMVIHMHITDRALYWYADSYSGKNLKAKAKRKKSGKALAPSVAREVETNLARDSVDITPIIISVVGNEEEVVPMSRWDFNVPAHPVIDPYLVSRLRLIFQTYAERTVVIERGLTSGKIDGRRLYRAPINGKCFMMKRYIPRMNWNICLLIDASGSMRGPKWKMVENTVGTIHKAFVGFENSLQAYAYFESGGISMISSLLKGNTLLSIPPSGQTASGQAIIAAAYFMPNDGRRKLIIHITDGESNYGCDVAYGIEFCRKQNIHLITLGVGYKDRDSMLKQYGKNIQFLDHFGQLPTALENLLRRTFLYGTKGTIVFQETLMNKIVKNKVKED